MNTKLKVLLPIVFILVAVVAAVALVQARPVATKEERQVPAPMVRTMTVSQQDVALEITAQGTVRSRAETVLAAEVAGRIASVSPRFAAGNTLRRGELVAQLDGRDFQVALAQAEAALAQAQVRLSREEAEAEIAREEWERLGKGQPSALVAREPQLMEARAAVAAARASIAQAKLNLERTSIRAPYDGVLLTKHADLGQFVGPGTPIARIAAADVAEVELPVSAEDLTRIDVASSPRVTLQASGGVWTGRVVRTGPQIDPQTRMLPLIAAVQSPFAGPTPLKIGEFVQASISGRTLSGVVRIPRAALRQGRTVLVVEDGTLRVREVEVVRLTAGDAFIQSGLKTDDRVILSNLDAPVDGMPVRVADAQPAEPPVREAR